MLLNIESRFSHIDHVTSRYIILYRLTWHYILAQLFACNKTALFLFIPPPSLLSSLPLFHLFSLYLSIYISISVSICLSSASLYDSRKLQMVSISCYTIARKCSRSAQWHLDAAEYLPRWGGREKERIHISYMYLDTR